MCGLKTQFPKVGIGDSAAQLVVILTPVERPLDIATQWRRVNVIEQIQAPQDMVIFPQGTPGFVFEGKGTELTNDDVLRGRFEGQRDHNALKVVPFFNDQLGVELT